MAHAGSCAISISMRSGALPMRCTVPSMLPAVAGSIGVIGPSAAGEDPLPAPVPVRLQPPATSRAQHSSRGNDRFTNGIAVLFSVCGSSECGEDSVGEGLRPGSAAHVARQRGLLGIHLVHRV